MSTLLKRLRDLEKSGVMDAFEAEQGGDGCCTVC
jgi:hypothetical protein